MHNHQPIGNFDFVFELAYTKSYLPFLTAMERHPAMHWNMHTHGHSLGMARVAIILTTSSASPSRWSSASAGDIKLAATMSRSFRRFPTRISPARFKSSLAIFANALK